MIKLQKVCKDFTFGKEVLHILQNINLDIKSGEHISIIGPSGSGKSTLMYMIGLLDKPTSGQIFFDGSDVSKLNDDDTSHLRNRFIGFIFQQFNLINKLTVLENIFLPAVYAKNISLIQAKKNAVELAERFEIAHRLNMNPSKISGGEQQRVAIARALVIKPKIILADEPTGNLDTKTGNKIIGLLTDLNIKDKLTIITVTHDPNIAKKSKRIISIIDGSIKKS